MSVEKDDFIGGSKRRTQVRTEGFKVKVPLRKSYITSNTVSERIFGGYKESSETYFRFEVIPRTSGVFLTWVVENLK